MDHQNSITPPDSPPPIWPKVFERLTWADNVVKARGYPGPTGAVFHRIVTRSATATGCTEAVGNMADGLGYNRATVQRALATLRADGYLSFSRGLNTTYQAVPNFGKDIVTDHVRGRTVLPQGPQRVTPEGPHSATQMVSSSKEKLKKGVTQLVDEKRGPGDGVPEHEGTFFSSVLEEEEHGRVTPPGKGTESPPISPPSIDADAWLTLNMPAGPMRGWAAAMLKDYKKLVVATRQPDRLETQHEHRQGRRNCL